MAIEEDPPAGVPEWIVTYGDMMSLLLTFFIMLVSMSELKQTDKFQGVADSLHQQFGYDSSISSLIPGDLRPRNSTLAAMALTGRSKRRAQMEGGVKEKGSAGDNQRVRIIRPGNRTGIGTVIFFEEAGRELTAEAQADLRQIADILSGKPQKIEVRGHTSQRPATATAEIRDNWDLAYARAHATMEFLVRELKIDPQRIRMSVAGPYEPTHSGVDAAKLRENPRVEVFMLEEVVSDLVGTAEEQAQRFLEPTTTP
ncbi:MAG: flagellar motor protein MotB [Pirellulaceae bacterium]|nr:flagellar motor protein MotB [Pirellulaceae bacterium]